MRSVEPRLAAALLFIAASGPLLARPRAQSDRIRIAVNANEKHQTIDGFGAWHQPVLPGNDPAHEQLRHQALEALYTQVQLTVGNLDGALAEGSPDGHPQNDNDDPFQIDPLGFQTPRADAMRTTILDRLEAVGFDGYYPAQRINVRWASPWLGDIRRTNYKRYLDEAAEQVVAAERYWREALGRVPPYEMLFNEPLSGNAELADGTEDEVVDLVKRIGARLKREGFPIKFVVPNEETEEQSLSTARAILGDKEARAYVGVIGYHTYPYGSPYTDIATILRTSAQGRPDRDRVAIRRGLRDLARKYKLPLWMTETSHGNIDPMSFDAMRGRAVHIHDELVYADASAYFGMNSVVDDISGRDHSGNVSFPPEEGDVVLIETKQGTVRITGMGYAIGHYARWLKRGAVRVGASTTDRLTQVSAFRDDIRNRLTIVLINNESTEASVDIDVKAVTLSESVTGEQSASGRYWVPISDVSRVPPGTLSLTVPAESVTTLAIPVMVP